ncbi:alcohol dehydrogenase catalytic domain-containing protein [Acrocarpospora catenulata]|uniref:alcohol dehydrogenase catalytic domain-containing protein n=1 Tax=Acrocarpospora catenulata TaxID=2836182 RepID=UPI001BD9BD50|nr:alcohol dehydrogenase catalytic domain-containing protein [Acrocarpospora catenulata]
MLGPRDVRLDVLGVGVCGSDVALYRTGGAGPDQVLGHEIVARVTEAGEAVTGLPVGTVTMVRPMRSCGRCPYCADDATHLCDHSQGLQHRHRTTGFRRLPAVPPHRHQRSLPLRPRRPHGGQGDDQRLKGFCAWKRSYAGGACLVQRS